MGYPSAPGDEWDRFFRELEMIKRRLSEMERPDGSQTAQLVQKLFELINGLLEQTDVNVSGNVTAGGYGSFGGTLSVGGAAYFPQAYSNPVTVSYFAAYLNGDYRLGRTVSSRRYKQDIETWSPATQAFFALRLVSYRLKVAVEESGDEAPRDWGLIAEELVDVGLDWLVIFVDGKPEGIAYERIGAALIPLVQELGRRIESLESRVSKLEATVAQLVAGGRVA